MSGVVVVTVLKISPGHKLILMTPYHTSATATSSDILPSPLVGILHVHSPSSHLDVFDPAS